LNQTESSEKIDFVKRSETNVEEKRAIAGIVSEMVPPNASIGCDASSTVMETLKYLSEREDILVLTNSVKVIREMERSRFGILSTGVLTASPIPCRAALPGARYRNTIWIWCLSAVKE